jgi:hypothetical protein
LNACESTIKKAAMINHLRTFPPAKNNLIKEISSISKHKGDPFEGNRVIWILTTLMACRGDDVYLDEGHNTTLIWQTRTREARSCLFDNASDTKRHWVPSGSVAVHQQFSV